MKVIDLSVVKEKEPTMRACVQVPSTNFGEVMLDGDCHEESHLTWTMWTCSLGYFLPEVDHPNCSSP